MSIDAPCLRGSVRKNWKRVKLRDLCSPKQWKTISTDMLTTKGYPVYGANGKIGFYSSFNHEEETLLVTCRGATCGNLNICEKFSYVNGNAMALDNLSESVSLLFLFYALRNRCFEDVFSGSSQPQIIKAYIERITVPVPPLSLQEEFARFVGAVDKSKFSVARWIFWAERFVIRSVLLKFGA
ncbi:MAG: restriction endonuclease subunit S [Opitutales bacterium]|nr:restriction endonuclease subunit S [Opitutales bacterium]